MSNFRIIGAINLNQAALLAETSDLPSLARHKLFRDAMDRFLPPDATNENAIATNTVELSQPSPTNDQPGGETEGENKNEDEDLNRGASPCKETTASENMSVFAAAFWNKRRAEGAAATSVVKEYRPSASGHSHAPDTFSDRSAASIYASRKKALIASSHED